MNELMTFPASDGGIKYAQIEKKDQRRGFFDPKKSIKIKTCCELIGSINIGRMDQVTTAEVMWTRNWP